MKKKQDADELKALTGTETRNSYWFNMLDNFSEKAIQLRYREQTKTEKAIYNLFGSFKFNLEDRTLRVSVTNDFEYIVNKLTANFTVYELAEFTSLRSTYAKAMYRILIFYTLENLILNFLNY
ncbi:replication initiation protein [uncultured Helcococcus sp.]|uniref:replication initiation protein n=1 Tax=uncultured Helcococcus sp. TaxID=1072508 RepID=UPI00345B3C7A